MSILIEIAVLLIIVGIVWAIYYICTRNTYIVKVHKDQVMEFKTSMELTGLPIITFFQGKEKYNFLLDTGSNISYVNSKSSIKVTKLGTKDVFMGAEGKDMDCEDGHVNLYRNGIDYDCTISIADLDTAFIELKNEYGVTLTGILGCDFMDKYNYCLDFKELVVYIRK